MGKRRFALLSSAAACLVAAVALFFFASAHQGAVAQPAVPGVPGNLGTSTAPGSTAPGSTAPGAVPTSTTPAPTPSTTLPRSLQASSAATALAPVDPTIPLPRSLIPQGKILFIDNCSSCHGTDASGSSRAPNLRGLGAATVNFWVGTGRMPLAEPTQQAEVKPPRFNTEQTHAIAAFVNSLQPGGPGIPRVDLSRANEANGGDLFALNCAGCHTITGVGDALSAGASAPSLYQATPTQIYTAIRIGPGQMPRFSTVQLPPKQVNDLVAYVSYLHHASDPGGAGLGHVGPVTEGFIALLIGMGGAMLVAFWIGDRA